MNSESESAFGFSHQERLEYEQSLPRLRFVSLIESFLEESGMQAKDLASRMGRGKAWLSKLLSGRYNPTADTLAQMAFALGLRWEISLTAVDRTGTPAE
jgi:transcriptional regulator with XRE-family HTH domain